MRTATLAAVFVVFCAQSAFAADENAQGASTTVQYARDIRPILSQRCQTCHGSQIQMSGLRLDRREDALRGGASGSPAIVPGSSAESPLIRFVAGLDSKRVMPPAGERLTPKQVDLLRAWIDQGAIWPDELAEGSPSPKSPRSEHWAFQPIRQPEVPPVKEAQWVRNPIDAFVLAGLEKRGWKPNPAAEPNAILRRAYLDVIGLPPTVAQQEEFLSDTSASALDRVVNELLSRPSYGERWGRHWLDLVRYAETNGYERDAEKPYVWRYRDYVIRSLNEDKPFDRFTMEQLAGDELEKVTAETLIATGYHRLGAWDDEPADPKQDRIDQLDDIIRTTSETFLGLTVGCARCHDHKFDPITARDYYSMAAMLNGLVRPRDGRTELTFPIGTRDELAAEAERDKLIKPLAARAEALIKPLREEFLKSGKSSLPEVAVLASLVEPEAQTVVQQAYAQGFAAKLAAEVRAVLPQEVLAKVQSLEAEIAAVKAKQPDLPRGYFMHEPEREPAPMHVLNRGSAHNAGKVVDPAVPAILVDQQPSFDPGLATSHRRLALAQWLVSKDNPLTARVIVNRVWQHYFGHGLVRTPSNFGMIGGRPSHPELLDWLASWFRSEGWSLKKLHSLILTSNTYRMSKEWNQEYGKQDPQNELLWHVERQRLEVEAIRDSILAVSGRLNRKMYGPSMFPHMPEAVLAVSKDPEHAWKDSDETEASRRTIYAHVKRSMILPILEVMDFCDTTRPAGERLVSTVAPQALTLFNGEFVNGEAEHLAERIVQEAGAGPEQQIEYAYRLALARVPTADERQDLAAYLRSEEMRRAAEGLNTQDAHMAALAQMSRVIFNLNEFAYTD